MNVAELVMDAFVQQGGRHVFCVPGGHSMFLNEAADHHPDLEVISVLHEQTAAMACDAYFRTSKRMAMCLVTAGPGVMNALSGVAGAFLDGIPVLVVSGQLKTEERPTAIPRWAPMLPTSIMVEQFTNYVSVITDPASAPQRIAKAFKIATRVPGPVWLDVPLDLQATEV